MKLIKLALLFAAFALCAAIGFAGHFLAAVMLWIILDSCLASRRPGYSFVNTLGTLATATIVQEALDLIYTVRPELSALTLGFTDRNGSPIAQFNQQVITRTKAIPTVGNAGDAASATADVDVPVTLNNFKQLFYSFTQTEYSSTNRDLIRERAEPMAVAMANYIVDQIAALWTVGNFPARTGADAVANGATVNKTVLGAGWDYSHLVTMRAVLNKAGVPQMNRFYIGNSDVYASMLADLRIVGYLNNQANGEAIRTGKLPEVGDMMLGEYPNLTSVAGGNLVAACGTPDSTVYAHRVPRDPREVLPGAPLPGNLGIVTNPKTGMSVMVLEYIDIATLSINMKLLWMNGAAKGNVNNLQLITSA